MLLLYIQLPLFIEIMHIEINKKNCQQSLLTLLAVCTNK